MLARLAIVAALSACGGAHITSATAGRLEAQYATDGELRVVAFDCRDVVTSLLATSSGRIMMALALPDGDWLVRFDRTVARLSADGTVVRWSRELAIATAVVAGPDLVVALGSDDTAIGIRGDGSLAWRSSLPAIRGAARLLRAGRLTAIVGDDGKLVLDDSGAVRWQHSARSGFALADYVDGIGIVIVSGAHTSLEYSETPRREPLIARVLDPATGQTRARVELAADGDSLSAGQLARAGKRLVVRASDVRAIRVGDSLTATVVHKLVVLALDVGRIAVADVFSEPASVEALDRLPRPGPDEAVFITRGESGNPLNAELVDLATHRARRAPLLRPAIREPGEEVAHARVLTIAGTAEAFTWFGELAGTLVVGQRRVHGHVEWQEGGEGQRMFTPSPFIGRITTR